MDFNKIAQEAVNETALELKKDHDAAKIDEVIKTIDAVNMIAGVTENAIKDQGVNPDQLDENTVKQVALASAKAAILEAVK